MEIRYHELVTGWHIRICKTPQAYWSPVVDPNDVIGRTRLTTWAVGKMKRFVELDLLLEENFAVDLNGAMSASVKEM